jgi:hypothetical protein
MQWFQEKHKSSIIIIISFIKMTLFIKKCNHIKLYIVDDRNNLQMFIGLISTTGNINFIRIDTFIQFYIQDLTGVCDFQ